MARFSRVPPFDFSDHRMPNQQAAISSPYGPDATAGYLGSNLSSRFTATGVFDGATRDTLMMLDPGVEHRGHLAVLAGVELHGEIRVVQPVAIKACTIDLEVEVLLVDFDFAGFFPEATTVRYASATTRITDAALPGSPRSFNGETFFATAATPLAPHMNVFVRVSLIQTIQGGLASRSAVVEQRIRGDIRVIEGVSFPPLDALAGPDPGAYTEENQPV